MNSHLKLTQTDIINVLHVDNDFDLQKEISNRVDFIKNQLRISQLKSVVLGISGGIDSTVTGRLAQLAVEQLRDENYAAHFVAVRLPYGKQLDEDDANNAISFIKPDKALVINIKKSCDQILEAIKDSPYEFASEHKEDFILGNIKARQRMIVQYAIANAEQGLVIGTDHAAEALMGFFTKFGDGACDITPLTGLNKRRIKKIGEHLGAPLSLVNKKPTADLENLKPLRPDEDAYGVTYDEIDDFLEGKDVSQSVYDIIIKAYISTEHKRNLPISP